MLPPIGPGNRSLDHAILGARRIVRPVLIAPQVLLVVVLPLTLDVCPQPVDSSATNRARAPSLLIELSVLGPARVRAPILRAQSIIEH
jgi:hypothetical protein